MGWRGTLVGGIIGGFIGGPFGAIVGAGIGAYLTRDKNNQAQSVSPSLHLRCMFRSLGKLAKSDGVVSQEEADFIKSILKEINGLTPQDQKELIAAFNEGKNSTDSWQDMVNDVAASWQPNAYHIVMQTYCIVVLADDQVLPTEMNLLKQAENIFGLRGFTDQFFRENSGSGSGKSASDSSYTSTSELDEAYKLLGITSSATDAEVKKAWRKKALEFHPDKIEGKGLPDAFIAFANEQSRKINQAYETISNARGIK